MNYLAHALPFLDQPYFAVGTGVPDMLTVVARGTRVRAGRIQPLLKDPDPLTVSVAAGALQHLRDDARFHETRTFAETSLALAAKARQLLPPETGIRSSFLGHLLLELLLDACLIAEDPGRLERYYRAMGSVDARVVEAVVNRTARRPTDQLAAMISGFGRERFLSDYLDDARLLVRLNQIMRRVGFAQLPDAFKRILPAARQLVGTRRTELLAGIPA